MTLMFPEGRRIALQTKMGDRVVIWDIADRDEDAEVECLVVNVNPDPNADSILQVDHPRIGYCWVNNSRVVRRL